ncbi:MAG: hypothetical protein GDA68_18735 [Nitrospira sp. CR2.1]|nr:hypothetical protein [Nitrospira sp. CR2.1]
MAGDLELTKLHYEPGQPLEFQAKHPLIAIMAASMAQMCDDLKAENYVEVQFNHHEKGHFILTVQKMFHPTPHQLRQKAESQLTQRTAECDALKLVNDTHMKTVMKLSHVVEQCTAELEAAKDKVQFLEKKNRNLLDSSNMVLKVKADQDVRLDDLQAELERGRGLVRALPAYKDISVSHRIDENDYESWHVWVDHNPLAECDTEEEANAIKALYEHRQGMEG